MKDTPYEKKVVLFDIDDTLISNASIGSQQVRPFFFKETTRAVLKKLLEDNCHIIFSSSETSKEAIQRSLKEIGIKEGLHIEILGYEETKGNMITLDLYDKVGILENRMGWFVNSCGIIVEDRSNLETENKKDIVHIFVPIDHDVQYSVPPSDAYLKTVLLPMDVLKQGVKLPVEDAKKEINGGRNDEPALRLDNVYKEVVQNTVLNKTPEKNRYPLSFQWTHSRQKSMDIVSNKLLALGGEEQLKLLFQYKKYLEHRKQTNTKMYQFLQSNLASQPSPLQEQDSKNPNIHKLNQLRTLLFDFISDKETDFRYKVGIWNKDEVDQKIGKAWDLLEEFNQVFVKEMGLDPNVHYEEGKDFNSTIKELLEKMMENEPSLISNAMKLLEARPSKISKNSL